MDIKELWRRLYDTGEATAPELSPDVAESWRFCREHGVDMLVTRAKQTPDEQFLEIKNTNRELIEVALPILKRICAISDNMAQGISLFDSDCVMLEYVSVENRSREAEPHSNFCPGVRWDELSAGTNGIALAIRLDRPVKLQKSEHYCQDQHNSMCFAAPIHNEKGSVIGGVNINVVDIANFDVTSPYVLALAVCGAISIENELSLHRSYELINKTFDTISEGLIVLDEEMTVVNASRYSFQMFGLERGKLIGHNIEEYFRPSDFREKLQKMIPFSYFESTFHCGGDRGNISCNVSVTPMKREEKLSGAILLIKESHTLAQIANVIVGNRAKYNFDDLLTEDPFLLGMIEKMKQIAATGHTILLEGESGTGKELFAHSIHTMSSYRSGPFVTVNCASLPRELVESELFGYEKGAFTGAASQGNPGKFELANQGTIFLDEIGELPFEMQAKLLRVLDSHSVTRIGGKAEKRLNLRVIAATNRDLKAEIGNMNFRKDLYYRLNVITFNIPPLRERGGDIELLAKRFMRNLNDSEDAVYVGHKTITRECMDRMKRYPWPGNIRELQNIISHCYYTAASCGIDAGDLPEEIRNYSGNPFARGEIKANAGAAKAEPQTVSDFERKLIVDILKRNNNDILRSCIELGLSKSTFYRRLKKHDIRIGAPES
jgi:PAS domain S-box-containing protein